MGNVQAKADDHLSMIKSAEAYEKHGLFDEALELYQEVLSGESDLDDELLQKIKFKVEELGKEIEDSDKDTPYNLSTEEVTHIKTGLSIGESAPEICDSATAFKELGLYREAASEYKKLFKTDLPIDEFFGDYLESMFTISSPSEIVKEVESIIQENELDEKIVATVKFMLGSELDKRNYKELAINSYEAVQKIDPIYPKIKEKIESVQPDKRFDSRYDYLLRNKIVNTDQLQKVP